MLCFCEINFAIISGLGVISLTTINWLCKKNAFIILEKLNDMSCEPWNLQMGTIKNFKPTNKQTNKMIISKMARELELSGRKIA